MGPPTDFSDSRIGLSASQDFICLLADFWGAIDWSGRSESLRLTATFRTSFIESVTPRLRDRWGSCVDFSGVLELNWLGLGDFAWRRGFLESKGLDMLSKGFIWHQRERGWWILESVFAGYEAMISVLGFFGGKRAAANLVAWHVASRQKDPLVRAMLYGFVWEVG